MKQLCFMIISLIIISLVKAEKLKTELKTDKKAPITISKTGRSSFRVNPFSLPKDSDIYWQGWVKYFHYDTGTHFERPLAFFRNNEYYTQRIKRKNMLNGDLAGTIKIPSKFQFFLVLYNNSSLAAPTFPLKSSSRLCSSSCDNRAFSLPTLQSTLNNRKSFFHCSTQLLVNLFPQ